MTENMNYYAARDYIKNGDIIHVYRSGGGLMPIIHAAIEFFTKSPIYHVVMAVWMTSPTGTKRLMCVETNLFGGKRLIPLSVYENHKLEVTPVPETFDFNSVEPKMMTRVGQEKYGFMDLFSIGMREFFGWPRKNFNGQVCSELVGNLLVAGGVDIEDTLLSPGKLHSILMEKGITPTMRINF